MTTLREELTNLEYLALAQRKEISANKFALLVKDKWVEKYVASLSDKQVRLQLINNSH